MFIFHEGLPGSGKSFEAVVKHLVPALAKGRPVDAYIEGLNHEKLADLAGITVEKCRELLVQIEREQVPDIWKVSRDNAFVFIDEMQNFWPSDKRKLGPEITQFITEHRHRGQDILGMGQDIRDVHAMWRRRCAQKVVFSKLDGLGREGNYSVRILKAVTPEKYEEMSKTVGKYDERYFGSYASHVSDDTNTENYKDKRAVIWNSWAFRVGIPAFCLVALASMYYVYNLFWGGELVKVPNAQPAPAAAPVAPVPGRTVPGTTVAAAAAAAPPADYVQELSSKWRARLSGYMEMGQRQQGVVEWYDSAMRRQEMLDFRQLEAQGYRVRYVAGMVYLNKGFREIQVTSWPIEAFGKLSNQQNTEVAAAR